MNMFLSIALLLLFVCLLVLSIPSLCWSFLFSSGRVFHFRKCFLSYFFNYFPFCFLPFLIIVWDNFGHSWIHPLSLLITIFFFLFSNFSPYHLRQVLLLFYSFIYGFCKFQQIWIVSYGFSFHNLPPPSFFSFSHPPAPPPSPPSLNAILESMILYLDL